MATTFLTPRAIVTVNGIPRRTIAGSTSCGFESAFATARIQFPSTEQPPEPGDRITIALGYQENGTMAVFAGEVDDNGVEYWPNYRSCSATGFLARTQVPMGVPQVGAPEDPDTGEIPAFYAESMVERNVVASLLSSWGVPMGDIQFADPELTLGTIEPVILGINEAAWRLIRDIDQLAFMVTFDAPDGTTRRMAINGIPSSAAFTLTQGVSILSGSLARSRRGIINSVTAVGLQDAGGPGITPRATRRADSPYIPTPPRYQSEEWQTSLIETEEVADRYAALRVGQMNRLQEQVQIGIERGRPDIQPAMSLAIDSDALSYGPGTLFWVSQVEHQWNSTSIRTNLTLRAATEADGVNPNQAPIAIIEVAIETEWLADGTQIWVAYADGSSSYDPDGEAIDLDPKHGIATYLWSGDPEGPSTPAALPRATYVYTANPTGATITLQVTDSSLKIGAATVTLTAAQVEKAGRRDLWLAVTEDLLLTTNAGRTWYEVGFPAVKISRRAHPEYQLAADGSGNLAKITITARDAWVITPIATPSGVTAVYINIGEDGLGTDRCWVGCADGSTWLSPDNGLTWFPRGTITAPTGAISTAVLHIEESPYSFGLLYALCGNAMFLSYDEGMNWEVVRAYPDPNLTAVSIASGRFADLSQDTSYHWAVFAGTSANDQQRVLESEDFDEVDWPVEHKPAQPTSIALGIYTPEMFIADQQGDGKIFYLEDFTGGGNLVQREYDIIWGKPWDLLPDGLYDGIVYGIATNNAFKTIDKFATMPYNLKDLFLPQIGAMIATGTLRGPLPAIGNVIWVGASGWDGGGKPLNAKINALTADGFERRADHPCAGLATAFNTLPLVVAGPGALITYAHFRQVSPSKTAPGGEVNCYRSTDGGYTWVDTGLRYVSWVKSDGAGTVYALCYASDGGQTGAGRGLYRSDDAGATWANVFSAFPFETAHTGNIPSDLAVNPVNPLDVMLRQNSLYRSTDGGATFGLVHSSADQSSFAGGWGDAYTPDGNWFLWKQDWFPQPLRRFAVGGGSLTDVIPLPDGNNYQNFEYTTGDAIVSFSANDTVPVKWSEDQGATWATIFDVAQMPAGGDPFYASRPDCNDFIPGDEANGWYWFGNSDYGIAIGQAPPGDDPPTDAYASLQAQLVADLPDTSYWCVLDGAVRLEEESV